MQVAGYCLNKISKMKLQGVTYIANSKQILRSISTEIQEKTTTCIIGKTGSGKSTLGKILAGVLHPTEGTLESPASTSQFVEQQDNFFSLSSMRETYYGQRYENFWTSNVPLVSNYLSECDSILFDTLRIKPLEQRKLLQLSNGERKRVQLAYALMHNPNLLVLDQPYIGLDAESQEILTKTLSNLHGTTTIVIITNSSTIPHFTDNIIELEEGRMVQNTLFNTFTKSKEITLNYSTKTELHLPPPHSEPKQYNTVVRMQDISVAIGGTAILSNISWHIKQNEKWLLTGHNGAGKSTLLSLITGDNPKAYNNNITLFDKPRGSGESIWDIKQKIGFVSPELHLYFMRKNKLTAFSETYRANNLDCLSVVTSGFNDEVGFSSKVSAKEKSIAQQWMKNLHLQQLVNKQFSEVSLGEQRMLLLIRTIIKQPHLLILDEPCQGLDAEQVRYFLSILESLSANIMTTMIYVTHNAAEIPNCITHELTLKNGSIDNIGTSK